MKTAYQIDYDDYLEYHGIKGQKWGVRNGPPYPLGASEHSASEKKAGWQKSLDKTSSNPHTNNTKSFIEKCKKRKVSDL